jgi:hypothetical protein
MADVRAYGKSLLIFLGFAALLARTTEGVRPQRSALPAGAAPHPRMRAVRRPGHSFPDFAGRLVANHQARRLGIP